MSIISALVRRAGMWKILNLPFSGEHIRGSPPTNLTSRFLDELTSWMFVHPYRKLRLGTMPSFDVVWNHANLFGEVPPQIVRYAIRRLAYSTLSRLSSLVSGVSSIELSRLSTLISRGEFQGVNMAWWQALVDQYNWSSYRGGVPSLYDLVYRGRKLELNNGWVRFAVLKYCSEWYWRLKPGTKKRIFNMCFDDSSFRRLKDICSTADGVLNSIYLSCPVNPGDRDKLWKVACSIISQSVFRPEFGVILKDYKKKLRKSLLSTGEFTKLPVELRCLWHFIKHLTSSGGKSPSKTKMGVIRVLNFCQTRNSGCAPKELFPKSRDKLLSIVTLGDIPLSHHPGYFLEKAFDENITRKDISRAVMGARVSISTSACFETPRSNGGKSHFASLLIDDEVCMFDLETGERTEQLAETYGEKIFHRSIAAYKSGYENFYDVNLTIVSEPGCKARAVTSSAFFHSQFLQVYSHVTLELLRGIPESASGVSKTRHGWNFVEMLNEEWLFEVEEVWGLSTDLETSTDYFSWNVARDLLETINDYFSIPKWYGNAVIDALVHSRRIYYSGKIICQSTSRGIFMGDPVTKTLLTCVGLAALYRCKAHNPNIIACLVGDDYAAVSSDRRLLDSRRHETDDYNDPNSYDGVSILSSLVTYGMRISADDTYTSKDLVYFSEECVFIPRSRRNTLSAALEAKDRSRIPYADIVKGRLLLDLRKNRDDFTYNPVGRINQLGRDSSYCQPGSHRAIFDLASILQDVCLDLRHHRGFVYFPREICGEGKPIPFDNARNFIRWCRSHRRGYYFTRYNWLIEQSVLSADYNVYGVTPSRLGSFYTNMNRHFSEQHWIVKIPDRLVPKDIQPALKIPKYQEVMPGVMGRLRDYLMSRSEFVGKIASILSKESHLLEMENDIEPNDIESVPFDPDLVEDQLFSRFVGMWSTTPYRFAHIRSEEWYKRDEVEPYLKELDNFRVHFHMGDVHREERSVSTEAQIAGKQLYEWYLAAQDAVKSGDPIPEIPRKYVSDDEIILNYDLKRDQTVVWIVTGDIKLAREYAIRRKIRFGTRYRTFVLYPKFWIFARAQVERFKEPCRLEMVPRPTIDNMVMDVASIDVAFGRMRAVQAGELGVASGPENPELFARRNRLQMVYTEVIPVLPFEEYSERGSREIFEFRDFDNNAIRAVVRNAEVRTPAQLLGYRHPITDMRNDHAAPL